MEKIYIYKYYSKDNICFNETIYVTYLPNKNIYLSELFKKNILNRRIFNPIDMGKVLESSDIFGKYLYVFSDRELDFNVLTEEYLKEQLDRFKSKRIIKGCE